MKRDIELAKKAYSDSLIINSEEFDNVSYEIKRRAMSVMIWNGRGITRFPGKIDDMERFAHEILDICREWRDVRT